MLTADAAAELIRGGETFTVEFKSERREKYSDEGIRAAVVCLANGLGGTLLLGVENDGEVTGARPRHGERTDVQLVDAMIANGTVPSATTATRVLQIGGKPVLAIEVGRSLTPLSDLRGTYRKRAIGSDGRPACVPYPFHEMQAAAAPAFAADFSARVLPGASWADVDPLEIERLRSVIRANRARADAPLADLSAGDLCRALGIAEGGEGTTAAERVTVAGLLLLGRPEALRRLVPTHEVAFQVRRGTSVEVNDFFRRPLIWVAEELQRRLEARNREEEMDFGTYRIGVPDFSPDGYREAVNNALVHRDYSTLGAIHVQWDREGISVANPGGLVPGVTVDTLLVTAPRPRNPVLADVFKRVGLVERTGRGVDRIYEGQLRYGRPAPDYGRTVADAVHVLLRGGRANLALVRWYIERYSEEEPATVEDMIVINLLESERYLSVERAAAALQRDAAAARQLLERLVDRGALEAHEKKRRGRTRERMYQLSGEAYEAIGASVAYSRRTGLSTVQHEQLLLNHLQRSERVTRAEVEELCHLSKEDAATLLRRLVDRGAVVLHPNRRWSYYTRA